MLQVKGLRSSYQGIEVLHGVDLELPSGEIRAILGANASGKSTLIKTILGLVHIDGGTIRLGEVELSGLPSHEISKRGIGWVPQGRMIFSMLTVHENLLLGAFNEPQRGRIRARLDEAYSRFPMLHENRHRLAKTLSGGQQQILSVARALMSNPQVLLMDEPSVGLAPKSRHELIELAREVNKTGVSILIVEQNARLALTIASWAYVLERGLLVASGSSQEIGENDALRSAYLGNYQ